jgi:hypothetical protein
MVFGLGCPAGMREQIGVALLLHRDPRAAVAPMLGLGVTWSVIGPVFFGWLRLCLLPAALCGITPPALPRAAIRTRCWPETRDSG